MNPNKNHISPLAHQIDHLIETGHPIGIPAADNLAATIPQARPEFQKQLEARLTTHMQIEAQGDRKLTSQTILPPNMTRSRVYIPLTLAAAMLAVMLVGGFLLFQSGKKPDSNLAQLSQVAATPTPIRMVNILVAYQNLPRGYQFPSTVSEIAAVVGSASWPEYAIPINAILEDQGGLKKLIGKILRTDVYREQPIMNNMLTNDLNQIASVGSDIAAVLPPDQLAISLPINLTQGLTSDMQPGMQVDISALVSFVGGDGLHTGFMMQKIARNATIIRVDNYTSMTSTTPPVILISALQDEVQTLALLVGAEIPMSIELSNNPVPTSLPNPINPAIAEDNVAITIPTSQIILEPPGTHVQVGDHVTITAEFMMADAGTQFAPETPVIVIPPTPAQPITVIPPHDSSAPHWISQEVINDTEVINIDNQGVTVVLSPHEEAVIRWLLDAKIPLTLRLG